MTGYDRDTIPESATTLTQLLHDRGLAGASGLIKAAGQLIAGAGR